MFSHHKFTIVYYYYYFSKSYSLDVYFFIIIEYIIQVVMVIISDRILYRFLHLFEAAVPVLNPFPHLQASYSYFQITCLFLLCPLVCLSLFIYSHSHTHSHSLTLLQWSTSRRCRPSLRARGPLGPPSRGILPPPHLRGAPSSPLLRWKSPALFRWRCVRCHENSAPRTRKTGTACDSFSVLIRKTLTDPSLKITKWFRENIVKAFLPHIFSLLISETSFSPSSSSFAAMCPLFL